MTTFEETYKLMLVIEVENESQAVLLYRILLANPFSLTIDIILIDKNLTLQFKEAKIFRKFPIEDQHILNFKNQEIAWIGVGYDSNGGLNVVGGKIALENLRPFGLS